LVKQGELACQIEAHGGEDEPVEGERMSPEEREREAHIQRMVRAARDIVTNSPVFKRVVEDHALTQRQLAMTRNSELKKNLFPKPIYNLLQRNIFKNTKTKIAAGKTTSSLREKEQPKLEVASRR